MKFPRPLLVMSAIALAAGIPSAQADDARSGSAESRSITEFAASDSDRFGWRVVNDGVMGGLSRGVIGFTAAGTMTFAGELSLENNGGFSTVRSGKIGLDLSQAEGLLIRVKGDGRSYQARLATDARYRFMEVSFSGEFATTRDQWSVVKVPFSEFEASFRGRQLPDKQLDPSKIRRLGILLGDKKTGAFNLEIDWIRTYGKG